MKKIYYSLFLIFISFTGNSQEITNLIFEGAGIRGLAYAGALEVLEEKNMLDDITQVGGTSAGAITALMISLGYSSHEVSEIISSTDFGDFNDGEYMFVGGFYRIKNNFGWYKTDVFLKWLEEIILEKTKNKDITFEELEELGFKNLYVTATCLNKQKTIVFSKKNYPKMMIKDAVRISMSVPLYFEAIFIDENGKINEKPDSISKYDIVMDGGVLGNFPIDIFDSYCENDNGEIERDPNYHTLAFRIDSKKQIENDQVNQELSPITIENMQDYLIALYIMVIENLNRNTLKDFDWERTVSISDADIGPKVKSLSEEQKKNLIENGRTSTEGFFK